MRLTFAALGWTFDWSIEPTATEGEDAGNSLDGGYTQSTVVGFMPAHDNPDMVGLPPDRSNGWPDEDRG